MTDTNWIESIYQILEQEYALYGDIELVLEEKRQAIIAENIAEVENTDTQLESLSFKTRELEKKRLEKITLCMGEPVSLGVLITEISEPEQATHFKAMQEKIKTRILSIQTLIGRNQQLVEQSLEKLNRNIGFWTNLLSQEHHVYVSQGSPQKQQQSISTVMHNA